MCICLSVQCVWYIIGISMIHDIAFFLDSQILPPYDEAFLDYLLLNNQPITPPQNSSSLLSHFTFSIACIIIYFTKKYLFVTHLPELECKPHGTQTLAALFIDASTGPK